MRNDGVNENKNASGSHGEKIRRARGRGRETR